MNKFLGFLFFILIIEFSNGSIDSRASKTECTVCLFVVGAIEGWLYEEKPTDEIIKYIEFACSIFPEEEEYVCDAIVDIGVPAIIGWLENSATPQTICKNYIKLCPMDSTKASAQWASRYFAGRQRVIESNNF